MSGVRPLSVQERWSEIGGAGPFVARIGRSKQATPSLAKCGSGGIFVSNPIAGAGLGIALSCCIIASASNTAAAGY